MKRQTLRSLAQSLRGKRIHVVGMAGTECTAFLRAMSQHGVTGFVVHDLAPDLDALRATFHTTHVALAPEERTALLDRLLAEAGELRMGARYLEGLFEADAVFVSQAWDLYPQNAPILDLIARAPERVLTLMDLMLRLLPGPVIGITGTNGKTTVASMVAALLEAADVQVAVGGNHRYHDQLLPRIDAMDENAVAVLEVSHKHLIRLEKGPDVAVITNVAGDHLDQLDRGTYEARKARLVEAQTASGLAVLSADDAVCRRIGAAAPGRVLWVSAERNPAPLAPAAFAEGDWLIVRGQRELRVPRSALRVPGAHNVHDALCAMAAVSPWVTDAEVLARGLRSFRGVKHRLEYLRRISGIPVYDDTAASSPSATAAALRALGSEGFPGVVLIAGGDDKNNEYDELHAQIRELARAVVLLPGTVGDLVASGVGDTPTVRAGTLEEAMRLGFEAARAGDALLVSPAGAGFFTRFAEGAEAPGLRTLVRRWGR